MSELVWGKIMHGDGVGMGHMGLGWSGDEDRKLSPCSCSNHNQVNGPALTHTSALSM